MVSKQTVTLANSIVGVSVLAMPFCFKQCGVILATVMLILGAVITRTVCYFLLKAGTITRRRNYEMLAWHTFGQGGKFIVEISIIGFLFGTLIAFFVVMGDLGPAIISETFSIENNYSLRNIIMTALSLFVALPLGLLRNMDSLSSVSTASVLFYVFLVFEILSEGLGPLFSGSYLDKIDYWRPAGVLQCIPILSMALSCQTQIFAIYESLPDPSLQKMNTIVKQAVTICTLFYFCVGFFGYIAFCHQSFGGNILMSLSSSWTAQLIKLCFLMSIVFSVPLVVFPCRASLNSLIFRRVNMHHSLHDISTNYIPEGTLKLLTIFIIGFTLVVGILIPNIELVLGLVGSTTGSVICIIFPSIMFIQVTSKQTTERLLAQVIFFTGIIIMVVSSYATLSAVDHAPHNQNSLEDPLPGDTLRVSEIVDEGRNPNAKVSFQAPDVKIVEMNQDLKNKLDDLKKLKKEPDSEPHAVSSSRSDLKHHAENLPDPVIPQEHKDKMKVPDGSEINVKTPNQQYLKPQPPSVLSSDNSQIHPKKSNQESEFIGQPAFGEAEQNKNGESQHTLSKAKSNNLQDNIADSKTPKPPSMEKDSAVDILKKLEVHQENQKKLLEEQKQILEELKEHHEQDVHRQQQSDIAPLKADQLINAVAREDSKIEEKPIDQNVIDKKVEVLQQEKLIEKLSENIEKNEKNVKIIEKIEAGLNKEIVNIDNSEPKLAEKVKLPDPVPIPNNHEIPIVVGERVGQVLKNVRDSPNPNVPDPDVIVRKNPKALDQDAPAPPASPSKQMLKPIPIQGFESYKTKENLTKQNIISGADRKSSINSQPEEQDRAALKQGGESNIQNDKQQHKDLLEEKKSEKINVNSNVPKPNIPIPKNSEPVKQVDRDI